MSAGGIAETSLTTRTAAGMLALSNGSVCPSPATRPGNTLLPGTRASYDISAPTTLLRSTSQVTEHSPSPSVLGRSEDRPDLPRAAVPAGLIRALTVPVRGRDLPSGIEDISADPGPAEKCLRLGAVKTLDKPSLPGQGTFHADERLRLIPGEGKPEAKNRRYWQSHRTR